MAQQNRVEHLAGEHTAAKAAGRGTDAGRIAKHLAALGAGPDGKPLPVRDLHPQAVANQESPVAAGRSAGPETAAENRAAETGPGDPPKGRTSPASRQQRT